MTSWTTLLAALIGGLVGGGIPAVMSYLAGRREQMERRQARQWQDAEVLADVYQLLVEIDPARCGMSLSTEPGVEEDRWAGIGQRLGDVSRRLLWLASGHPSAGVQAAAQKLEPELSAAATQSRHHVFDMLRRRDIPEQLQSAQQCHEVAVATADELDRAVKRAGSGAHIALPGMR
jgi:hypothetical protein